jgi:hypothetical protein
LGVVVEADSSFLLVFFRVFWKKWCAAGGFFVVNCVVDVVSGMGVFGGRKIGQ